MCLTSSFVLSFYEQYLLDKCWFFRCLWIISNRLLFISSCEDLQDTDLELGLDNSAFYDQFAIAQVGQLKIKNVCVITTWVFYINHCIGRKGIVQPKNSFHPYSTLSTFNIRQHSNSVLNFPFLVSVSHCLLPVFIMNITVNPPLLPLVWVVGGLADLARYHRHGLSEGLS